MCSETRLDKDLLALITRKTFYDRGVYCLKCGNEWGLLRTCRWYGSVFYSWRWMIARQQEQDLRHPQPRTKNNRLVSKDLPSDWTTTQASRLTVLLQWLTKTNGLPTFWFHGWTIIKQMVFGILVCPKCNQIAWKDTNGGNWVHKEILITITLQDELIHFEAANGQLGLRFPSRMTWMLYTGRLFLGFVRFHFEAAIHANGQGLSFTLSHFSAILEWMGRWFL